MQEHFVEKKSPFCSKFSTLVEFFSTKGNIPLEYTRDGQDLLITDSMWLLVLYNAAGFCRKWETVDGVRCFAEGCH